MSELLEFASRLIELEGGAVEPREAGLSALLPAHLGEAWRAHEELEIGAAEESGRVPLAYGTELLERMIETATQQLPVAAARLATTPLRASQVRGAAEHWHLRNGVVQVGEVLMRPQTRLWLDALATLHGDEKRELLVSAACSLHNGTLVEGFEDAASCGLEAHPQGATAISQEALSGVLGPCAQRAEQLAGGFHAAMTRRFERDRERIEGYFETLLKELDGRAAKGRLDHDAIADKRRALLLDRAAKLDALAARFVLRIEVLPIALRIIEVDGAFATMTLRRRKASRSLELEYDAATRRLVPPRCDGCKGSAHRPAACDDAVHLLCETCAPRSDGRIACVACKSVGTRDAREGARTSAARP